MSAPHDTGHRQRSEDGGLRCPNREATAPVERLAALCEAAGAEKLPGRLRLDGTPADIRQALAWLRGELDTIERELAEDA